MLDVDKNPRRDGHHASSDQKSVGNFFCEGNTDSWGPRNHGHLPRGHLHLWRGLKQRTRRKHLYKTSRIN